MLRLFQLTTLVLISSEMLAQGKSLDFNEAKLVDLARPIYPLAALQKRAESWVVLTAMIDSLGTPYEIRVKESAALESGLRKGFEQAAMRSLQNSTFEPSRLNGEPRDSSFTMLYPFFLENNKVEITQRFKRRQDNFEQALSEGVQEKAELFLNQIEELGAFNRSEYALLEADKYQYSLQFFDDIDARADHLYRALMVENLTLNEEIEYPTLPDEMTRYLRLALLSTEIERSRFGEAQEIAQMLSTSGADLSAFSTALQRIKDIKTDETQYSVFGSTDDGGDWGIKLHKRTMYLDNLGNALNELRFYCQHEYRALTFMEGQTVTIPPSWGDCFLVINGAPNATLELIQFRSDD
ncbi:MAG: hypothetical protein CMD92_05460 [Gammaproteobacteria bacterium]|nr:hypothetical protein [Gammaproteobacteria bacterium]